MIGARSARFAILTLAVLATDCGPRVVSAPPAKIAVKAPVAAEPVYRYVSLGSREPARQMPLDAGRVGVLTWDTPGRAIVNPDGSVELAAPGSRTLLGFVPVPARLGGGFLFWDDMLYRAGSFNGQLEPVVDLPTNAIGVEFGPDYLLLLISNTPPRAFALDPPRALPMSPKGVIDVAATDDGRALALDATGRALASTDAGKSWNDVTASLAAPVSGVAEGANEVGFVLPDGDAMLQSDGQFVRRAPPARGLPAQATPAELLRRALSHGLPLPELRALVGDGNGTRVVDLRTGSATPSKPAGPEGSSCFPVSLAEDGLVVCTSYTMKPTTTVVSHALGATPVIEKTFTGTVAFVPDRELSIMASCSGKQTPRSVCTRRSGGVWTELTVPPEVFRLWRPMHWVPREDGGLSLIVWEREVFQREPKVALFDPQTGRITPWDLPIAEVTPNSSDALSGASFTLRADGSLRGFTTKGSITVDPQGHVTLGKQTFVSLSSAGTHAMARDAAEHLWQTSDSGAHWLEIARPPFDEAPEGSGAKVNMRPSGRATRLDCSLNGCVFEHSSGTGFWLRLGWPEDPAPAEASPNAPAQSTAGPPEQSNATVLSLPEPALPRLRCSSRAPGKVQVQVKVKAQAPVKKPLQPQAKPQPLQPQAKAKTPLQPQAKPQPRKPPAPPTGIDWQDVLGGKRVLARRGTHTFANVAYRDVFSADETRDYGQRAVIHSQTADAAFEQLIGKRAPLDVLFVEPFDEHGRLRQFTASIEDWSAFGVPARAGNEAEAERLRKLMERDLNFRPRGSGAARPVLSSETGRASGVLLLAAPAFFVRNNGQIRPVRAGCSPVSGYLDQHGKAFVACAPRHGSTSIEALDMPLRPLFSAPLASHFRARERAGLHFFPPGESLFVNPDALAVGRDDKLGILRLPPGNAPPTEDNPAWLLSADAAPLALAPWSTLELATSPDCAGEDGYRAIVQSERGWLDTDAPPDPGAGMTALVRWGTEHVCLEAVEIGYGSRKIEGWGAFRISAVARFAGAQPSAAFIGTESDATLRDPAICELVSR
jgi:hypothetical protein